MDTTRHERIRKAYIAADDCENATSETVLTAVYRAVPDASREEIGEVIKERIKNLGEEARFVLEISNHPNVDLLPLDCLEKFLDGRFKEPSN